MTANPYAEPGLEDMPPGVQKLCADLADARARALRKSATPKDRAEFDALKVDWQDAQRFWRALGEYMGTRTPGLNIQDNT